MSPERLSAASTSAGQVLGSTGEGTLIKAYKVAHIRASDVQAMLADPASPLLPRDSSTVVVDSRSNTLIIKGTPAEHQLIENLIRVVDVPARQVLLEVRIVSADEYFGQSLGARFGLTSSHMLNAAKPRSAGVQVGNTVSELNQIGSSGVSSFPTGVNLPATNTLTSAPVTTFALGLYKLPAGININLEISALEEAGHTKVLSSPKLVLSNQRAGLISSGQRIPYSKPSLVQGVSTTEFVDVKVSVAVTALVAPDGAISMELTLTDDNVGSTSSVGPTINTNQATSNVTLQSGETLLLGGFQSSSQIEEKNQTPLLGSIPVLGNLFRNRSNSTVKRELLFIITPTIIESEPR
jgi:type IV pilus assembly protein PilQ